jgi:hypothetical protein
MDGQVVARVQLDDVVRHAGGLSMLIDLAVPMHGVAARRQVVFYDLAEPESPGGCQSRLRGRAGKRPPPP